MSHSKRFTFTKTTLTNLEEEVGRERSFVYDTLVRGFCLMVTRTGHKSFSLNRTIYGRPLRIHIGPFLDIPIERARKKAEEVVAEIAPVGTF